jgi:hypothetical protein
VGTGWAAVRPRFLNIDLEILSARKPEHLLAGLGDRIALLVSRSAPDGHFTAVEIAGHCTTPLLTMREYTRMLSALSGDGRREWEEASRRVFNFGYETEKTPAEVEIDLPSEVLAAVLDLGGSIEVTVYNNEQITESAPRRSPSETSEDGDL